MAGETPIQPERESSPSNQRYDLIDEQNARSFWLKEPHTFEVRQSLHDTGGKLADITQLAARRILAGNTSPAREGAYGPLGIGITPEMRMADATRNFEQFIETQGVSLKNVRTMRPERDYSTPLTFVDIDQQKVDPDNTKPVTLDTAGDFIFTRNSELALAVRPADCPVVVGTVTTPESDIHFMLHLAWQGAASGYIKQAKEWFDEQRANPASFRLYVSPGAHAENYPYNNWDKNPLEVYPGYDTLFVDRHLEPSTKPPYDMKWAFSIDTPHFVYTELLKEWQLDPFQVFADTSDTGAVGSGYSSHNRWFRMEETWDTPLGNTRDTVLATFNEPIRTRSTDAVQ